MFEFGECQGWTFFHPRADASLKTADGVHSFDAYVGRVTMAMHDPGVYSQRPRGRVGRRRSPPSPASSSYVTFHVPNFPSFIGERIIQPSGAAQAGRTVLEGAGWKATLDAVDRPREMRDGAEDQGAT